MNCPNCHKDFCQCVKQNVQSSKFYKQLNTMKLLQKHGVVYGPTSTPGVVEVRRGERKHLLSLISETSVKRGDRNVKFRLHGGKWEEAFFSTFLKRIEA